MGHENGGWMNEEQRAASAAHVHSFAVDISCDCGIMLSAYVKGLGRQLAALQQQLDAESDIQHAQRQEIAALGLVNKELADALEATREVILGLTEPMLEDGCTRPGWEVLLQARAALRKAGRLP